MKKKLNFINKIFHDIQLFSTVDTANDNQLIGFKNVVNIKLKYIPF